MPLPAPRHLGQLQSARESRLSHKRLRAPTRLPSLDSGFIQRLLRWFF